MSERESPSESASSPPSSWHALNGEEDAALARMEDDGGPPLTTPESPAPPPPAAPQATPTETLSLEQRVRRLEEALALLQQQHTEPPRPTPQPVPPPTAAPPPTSTAVLLEVGKRMLGNAAQAMVSAPIAAPVAPTATPTQPSSLLWLLWDTWAEARVIVRMFVDPRYRLPWSARVLPLLLLAAILTSQIWVPGSSLSVIGWLIIKPVDLLLAFVLFKWLGHEARRYRQTSPDLPPNLRL